MSKARNIADIGSDDVISTSSTGIDVTGTLTSDGLTVEADEDNDIEAADAYTRTDTYDTLDEAPVGATERTRMGIRYPELLAFVSAYNEQRFASIEAQNATF